MRLNIENIIFFQIAFWGRIGQACWLAEKRLLIFWSILKLISMYLSPASDNHFFPHADANSTELLQAAISQIGAKPVNSIFVVEHWLRYKSVGEEMW